MPKSETWPGGVAMESLASAGSCDSVVSRNSGSSDDSLEYLSPEERACLMFLEMTIESLEMEDEDSGLSNDEPADAGSSSSTPPVKVPLLSSPVARGGLADVSDSQHAGTGRDPKAILSCMVPTPLLLANGVGVRPPSRPPPGGATVAAAEPQTPEVSTESIAPGLLTEPRAEPPAPTVSDAAPGPVPPPDLVLVLVDAAPGLAPPPDPVLVDSAPGPVLRPGSVLVLVDPSPGPVAEPHASGSATDLKAPELTTDAGEPEVTMDPNPPPEVPGVPNTPPGLPSELPAPGVEQPGASPTPAYAADSAAGHTDAAGGEPESAPAESERDGGPSKVPSQLDLGLIPPPSDFRDEPEPEPEPPPATASGPGLAEEREPAALPTSPSVRGPLTFHEMEQLRKKASTKGAPPSSASPSPSPSPSEDPPCSFPEPRSPPPAVAPKPKRLPSNIILKSHKASAAADGHPGPSVFSAPDRVMMDPQKVRLEALRKLGLLKGDDGGDGGPAPHSPSFKSRTSWTAPLSPTPASVPASTPAPATTPPPAPAPATTPPTAPAPASVPASTPAPATTPASAPATTPPPGSATTPAPAQSNSPGPVPNPVPTPAAALDPTVGLSTIPPPAQFTDHVTPLPLFPEPSSPAPQPEALGLKSTSLASAGEARGPQGSAADLSPGLLRRSRPRPASLGGGQDVPQAEPSSDPRDSRRSLPAPAAPPSPGEQKKPRSQGVSVLIRPRGESREDRRQALRKLGLLRD